MDQNLQQQAIERIKAANNILVTVSKNPSIDQLAAAIGLTLFLNKLEKHATAVFSGQVPSTLEFLQPDQTIEQNTDSLRDFIIALDKSKADKLRYKVENDVVRIFITPYRTSISEKDLDFSQGDFNVDVVIAIGVSNKEDIDQAIVAHGRILHDATVISVTSGDNQSDVGAINWHDAAASSLSEMLVSVTDALEPNGLDGQMATAFLTGIVAETDRFSNQKTSPKVMTMSAQLMGAGANQQLIANKLAPPEPETPPQQEPAVGGMPTAVHSDVPEKPVTPYTPPVDAASAKEKLDELNKKNHEDGAIEIEHNEDEIHIDDDGNLKRQEELRAQQEEAERKQHEQEQAANSMDVQPTESYLAGDSHKVVQPLNDAPFDPLAAFAPAPTPVQPPVADTSAQLPPVMPAPVSQEAPVVDATPAAAEPIVAPVATPEEPVAAVTPSVDVDAARAAVQTANLDTAPRPEPMQSVGATPLGVGLNTAPIAPPTPAPAAPEGMAGVGDILQQSSSNVIEPTVVAPTADPMAPPPVPPPMMPPQITSHHSYLNPADQVKPEDTPTQM